MDERLQIALDRKLEPLKKQIFADSNRNHKDQRDEFDKVNQRLRATVKKVNKVLEMLNEPDQSYSPVRAVRKDKN